GPLNLIYYNAQTKKSEYLNAGLNKVSDPHSQFDSAHPVAGQSFVIGGAGPGLESLYQRYSNKKLSFKNLVDPAAQLARNGFNISKLYADALTTRAPLFTNSAEWNNLYKKNGHFLAENDTLIQTDLANTLDHYGSEGADYLMKGQYANDLVAAIKSNGGNLTLQDLANYQVYWAEPLSATYRDFTVQTSSYRSEGGLQLLMALKSIENFKELGSSEHFSKNEANFEKVLRTYLFSMRNAGPTAWEFANRLDDLSAMQDVLSGNNNKILSPSQIWAQVTDPSVPLPWAKVTGSHSCDTLVVDRDGNLITGNHTINSKQWGDYGLMVDGVSLNSAYSVTFDSPPGERAIDVLTPVMIFKDGAPWAAAGFFDSSLQASAFQVLLNLMDYKMLPNEALMTPRFGTVNGFSPLTMPIDPRYPQAWIEDFAMKGLNFQPPMKNGVLNMSGYVDTGDAMVIRLDSRTGVHYGSPSEVLKESVAAPEDLQN
ncbi:MAG: gamma-glutamyltransferase, partial [Pseudobdellovibrio sp.]